jgi:Ca-activated chloride channel homolog
MIWPMRRAPSSNAIVHPVSGAAIKQRTKTALIALLAAAIAFPIAVVRAQVNGPMAPPKHEHAAGSIQIDVDMVLVNAGVTDSYGHPVSNLQKKDFRLFEDTIEQEILSFSNEDVPASIGLLFDNSGSMADKIDASQQALANFLQKSNPHDEFFLVSFNNRAELTSRFTSDTEELHRRLASLKPNGRTALLDAIYSGVAQMKGSAHERHILLVLSDGGDNHSRHHVTEIRNLLKESDCQLYALGIFDSRDMKRTNEEREGPGLLSELTEMTGGHLFQAANLAELVALAGKIGTELRSQYILGYKPAGVRHDGSWHRLKVALKPAHDPPFTARARTGYYSPRD